MGRSVPRWRARSHAEVAGGRTDLTEQRTRHLQKVQQPGVPRRRRQPHEQGPGGVGGIGGVHRAVGQAGDQPGVDRSHRQLPRFRPPPQLRPLAQEPRDLRPREVGIGHQPRAATQLGFVARLAELAAQRRRAPVLPDDRPVHRLQRLPVPEDDRLPLVGDPEGPHLGARGRFQSLARHLPGHLPDLERVVLHPTRPGEVLREFRVCAAEDAPVLPHHEGGRARRALVDGEDGGSAHGRSLTGRAGSRDPNA